MKASYQTFLAGVGLAFLAWIGCFSSGTPSVICPMPIVTILPAFLLASRPSHLPYWLSVLVPAILFFAWNPGLFRGNSRVPQRSGVLLSTLTVLSIAYFVGSWRDGNHYQGHEFTAIICVVNIVWIVILWVILYRSSRLASFAANLLFNAALVAWVAWYAFPYLGELP